MGEHLISIFWFNLSIVLNTFPFNVYVKAYGVTDFFTAYVTGTRLSVRPSKIVAGVEAEKTNEFLQALADAVSKKVSGCRKPLSIRLFLHRCFIPTELLLAFAVLFNIVKQQFILGYSLYWDFLTKFEVFYPVGALNNFISYFRVTYVS